MKAGKPGSDSFPGELLQADSFDRRCFFPPLVLLSPFDWDELQQRPQFLARELSKHHRVLFVDPTGHSFVTHAARRLRNLPARRRLLAPQFRRIDDRITVATPPALLPFSMYSQAINGWNHRALRRLVDADVRESILWCTFPSQLPFVKDCPRRLLVYDSMDNYAEFYSGRRKRILGEQEVQLLGMADLVFASSAPLFEKCQAYARNCFLVPNGLNDCFFEPPHERPDDLPARRESIIGYVGAIADWFDWRWIELLADQMPGSDLVLIGPFLSGHPQIKRPNVHYLPPRPNHLIPAYLDHFDVALIPFLVNSLTHAVHPIKMLEYFARGLPVVAPRLQALKGNGGDVYTVEDLNSLVPTVKKAIAEGKKERLRGVADDFRWTRIADRVEDLLCRQMSVRGM
ncbi:MAG: glycosyltransferase [Acidobacteria bacterium]|nr:MAG: glycosyltransferase [Acidobacteriota bacterium]